MQLVDAAAVMVVCSKDLAQYIRDHDFYLLLENGLLLSGVTNEPNYSKAESHAVLPVKILTVAWHRPLDAQPQLGHILPQPLSGLAYKVYE
ncbi:hypothetical protein H671_1g1488 [Cricetulus griseus]|uniref:Uncharacterized protein n=1 Tax=Cricetulus griseus TaxID=10029 RepID=A0A061IPT7_CRIGR|nr:hypothetical protein H671_1g1488 [Cricetulus griseus]